MLGPGRALLEHTVRRKRYARRTQPRLCAQPEDDRFSVLSISQSENLWPKYKR
jgi:hypothetical protein